MLTVFAGNKSHTSYHATPRHAPVTFRSLPLEIPVSTLEIAISEIAWMMSQSRVVGDGAIQHRSALLSVLISGSW